MHSFIYFIAVMAAMEQDSEAQSFIYFIAVMTVNEQDSEVLSFMYMYLNAVNSIVLKFKNSAMAHNNTSVIIIWILITVQGLIINKIFGQAI